MKAEERKELATNSLATGAATLVEKAKAGRLLSPLGFRVLGVGIAVALIAGLWWYLGKENSRANSRQWAELASPSATDLENAAKNFKDSNPGRVARLEQARQLLGAQGIGLMTADTRDQQNKGIANVEKAREEFVALAEEFRSDKTLRATCFLEAAEAELALLGIPKTASGPEQRGTVKAAADLYRKAAAAIGDKTPAGEQFTKKAEDLLGNEAALTKAGVELYSRVMPLPAFDGSSFRDGVKAPTSIEPKKDAPPIEGVKPPAGPITPIPPAVTPTIAPPITPPVTPPVAPAVTPPVAPPVIPPVAPKTPTSAK